eukprot:7003814-Pyramimonas_sp.AAC.1
MRGKATAYQADGKAWGLTSYEVLRRWRILPMQMEAIARRLNWIRKMLLNSMLHQQVLTAIFGQLAVETEPT